MRAPSFPFVTNIVKQFDLIIRNGTVVTASDTMQCDIAINGGRSEDEIALSVAEAARAIAVSRQAKQLNASFWLS